MDFNIKKQLTNSRPPKSTEKTLTTSPTPGTLKLSEEAGIALGLKKGDYVGCVQGEDDRFYLYKGTAGTDGVSNDGSRVATANEKLSGTLNFSSANAYQALGGNETSVTSYTLEDGIEHEGKVYFALSFKESTPKQVRVKSKKTSSVEGKEIVEA